MRYFALALSVAVAGCTSVGTIRSQDVRPLSANQAMIGVSYALPAIQYTITTPRMLDKCDGAAPRFTIKPEVTATYVAGERFEVDPSNLSSVLKTTSLGLTMQEDNDTLKSFNAAADDKTGDVLVDAAKIGVSIASFAASGGTVPGIVAMVGESPMFAEAGGTTQKRWEALKGGEKPQFAVTITCSALAGQRIADYKAKVKALKDLEAELSALNEQIALQKSLAVFRTFAQTDVAALLQLVKDSTTKSAQVAAKRKEVSDAKDLLQIVSVERWPKASWKNDETASQPAELGISDPEQRYGDFCANFEVTVRAVATVDAFLASRNLISPPSKCEGLLLALAQQSKVRVMFDPVVEPAADATGINMAFTVDPKKASPGIFVREPERAKLVIEQQDGELMSWKTIYRDEERWVPQIGRLRFLEFESGPFENETLSLALRRDGRVESLVYQTKDAALARLAKAGADTAERIAKAREDAETEERSDIDRARADKQYARDEAKKNAESVAARETRDIANLDYQFAVIQRQRSLLAQQSLSDEDAAARANELTILSSDVALLKAEKERLELTRAVRELRMLEQN